MSTLAKTPGMRCRCWQPLALSMRGSNAFCGRRRLLSAPPTADGFGDVQRPEDINTRRLYADCMRLTYHIAAQA